MFFSGEADNNICYLTGTVVKEIHYWAKMLLQMYSRWAEFINSLIFDINYRRKLRKEAGIKS